MGSGGELRPKGERHSRVRWQMIKGGKKKARWMGPGLCLESNSGSSEGTQGRMGYGEHQSARPGEVNSRTPRCEIRRNPSGKTSDETNVQKGM